MPQMAESEKASSSSKGNARSLVVELSGSRISPRSHISGVDTSGFDRGQDELGLSISGRYQTDNYGLLGINAELRRGTDSRLFGSGSAHSNSGSVTLTDRNFPLGNGWMADSAAGMVTMATIPLAQRQPRFYLPTAPLLGGAVTLKRYGPVTSQTATENPVPVASVNLSVGEPGLLGGLRLGDFTGLSGVVVAGGGQFEVSPHFSAGVQAIAMENTRDPYTVVFQSSSSPVTAPGRLSAEAALGTIAYTAGGLRVQANAIGSRLSGTVASDLPGSGDGGAGASGPVATAGGAWLDGSYRTGGSSHTGGVYYFGPNLTWGNAAIVNDAFGAYYRFSSLSQRWRWSLSADAVGSVDGRSASGFIATADARRQLNFTTGVGLDTTVRVANGRTSSQLLSYVDFSTGWGTSRADLGWSHDSSSDLFHVGANQNWNLPATLPAGSRLTTQFSFDHRRQTGDSPYSAAATMQGQSNGFGAAINAGASPFNDVSFDATLAFNSDASTSSSSLYGPVDATSGALGSLSSQQGRAFSATISATARLSSEWSLSASFTDTQSTLNSRYGLAGPVSSPLGFTPAELAAIQHSSFRLRAGYLTLRYSASAGRANGAIGRREYPVGGTGALAGRVYLDGNTNHMREPAEAGVPGIVIILDGIFATRTDETGAYRFEGVADGKHRVTLVADALPLPWSILPNEDTASTGDYAAVLDVKVRCTTTLDIAAARE